MTVENEDLLEKLIESMIPKSLDDIIRQNQEFATLRLATEEEIMALHQAIEPSKPKKIIDNWNFINLHLTHGDIDQLTLIGDKRENGAARITSIVTGIDLDRQYIKTKSGSLYQLGTPRPGVIDQDQLFLICAAFHAWGFGAFLGVPNFYVDF